MASIREVIIRNELRFAEHRVRELQRLSALDCLIDSAQAEVDRLERGEIKIGGDNALLDQAAGKFENKVGRGGKMYVDFDNILYFPQAKYGRFITLRG